MGWSALFIAHSLVQVSLNITIRSSLTSLLKQVRPTGLCVATAVESIDHCRVQMSLNSTAPVARYSFVRHEVLGGGLVVPVLSALAGAGSPLACATTISFFGFAGEILKLRGGKSPASAAWGECSEAERSGGEGNKEGPDRHCGLRWSSWDGRPSLIVAAAALMAITNLRFCEARAVRLLGTRSSRA